MGLAEQSFFTDRGFGSLGFLEQQALGEALEPGFLQVNNPVVRHTVLRRRQTLEEAGLLERIGVVVHPDPDAPASAYAGIRVDLPWNPSRLEQRLGRIKRLGQARRHVDMLNLV